MLKHHPNWFKSQIFIWKGVSSFHSRPDHEDLGRVGFATSNCRFFEIHPQKQTWNLKMDCWKRRFLLETIISRFHVCFRGCKSCADRDEQVSNG